jgi:hypothetical protein
MVGLYIQIMVLCMFSGGESGEVEVQKRQNYPKIPLSGI